MTRVVGLGAGGHAKVVIDILQLMGGFEIVGLLDPRAELFGQEVQGVRVLGNDDLLPELARQGLGHAFVGLGAVLANRDRLEVYERVRAQGFELVTAIHPAAIVARSASLGPGATVMAGSIINADVTMGTNVIVNTGAVVEHDCRVGDHVHLATGARLAGGVHVGEGTLVGLGAAVRQGISIGRFSIVGAGAVVVDDVADGVTVVGIPARVLRTTATGR